MEEDPLALWNSLKERYDQQRAVMLPEAQREWSLIRFQDFKSVAAYNSAVHKINSKLRFCNKQVSDEDLIEKTLCTFHPSMRILQQQYRQQKYTKYSELIYTLLQAEKNFSCKITMLALRAPCQSLKHMLMLILLVNLETVNGTSKNSRESGNRTMVKRPTVHLRGMVISIKITKRQLSNL